VSAACALSLLGALALVAAAAGLVLGLAFAAEELAERRAERRAERELRDLISKGGDAMA
jgi:hypothetical protein